MVWQIPSDKSINFQNSRNVNEYMKYHIFELRRKI